MSTLETELALRDLMASYVDAVNRRDAQAWGNTWDENASWNLMGSSVQGREHIVALWQQLMAGFEFALMLPSTSLFEIDGNRASGHWYLQEFTRDLDGKATTLLSRYADNYRLQDGRWFYQSRDYQVLYHGDADLSGAYTPL